MDNNTSRATIMYLHSKRRVQAVRFTCIHIGKNVTFICNLLADGTAYVLTSKPAPYQLIELSRHR